MHHKKNWHAPETPQVSMGLRRGVGSFVNNDTVPLNGHTVRPPTKACAINSTGLAQALPPTAGADRGVRTADCRRRSAVYVGSADWQQTDFFLFRGPMNSVKILHAVRSAITAIAELLVFVLLSSSLLLAKITLGLHTVYSVRNYR